MTLFEVDRGRLIPAQFGHTVTDGLSDELLEAVRAQVLEIISRPLFPITWNDLSRARDGHSPRLTALDATGQVVSVEVLHHLTSENLIGALSSLADTAALSWTDLAREYPGGIPAFRHDWLTFRDSMPPSPGAGPRLIMVVGSIDSSARSALEVLVASGVEVHELHLRKMNNGRSFLSVSPVGLRVYAHVPQIVGHDSDMRQIDAPHPAPIDSPASPDEPTMVATADNEAAEPHGVAAENDHTSSEPDQPTGDAEDGVIELSDASADDVEATTDAGEALIDLSDAPAEVDTADTEADADTSSAGAEVGAELDTEADAVEGVAQDTVAGAADVAEAADDGEVLIAQVISESPADHRDDTPEQPAAQLNVDRRSVAPAYPRVRRSAAHVAAPAEDREVSEPPTQVVSPQHGTPAHMDRPAREDIVQVVERNSDGLRSIAVLLGEDVALVGSADVSLDVPMTLTAAGTIRVWYREFTDMDEALAYAGQRSLDGWNDLRLADALGPTLAEAIDEINIDIMREHQR